MRHHNTQCVIWWCGLRRSSTLHDGTKKKGGKKKGNTWSSILPSDKVAEKMRILNFVASLYRCQNIHVILRVPNELYQFFVFSHQKTMQTKQDKKKKWVALGCFGLWTFCYAHVNARLEIFLAIVFERNGQKKRSEKPENVVFPLERRWRFQNRKIKAEERKMKKKRSLFPYVLQSLDKRIIEFHGFVSLHIWFSCDHDHRAIPKQKKNLR